MTKRTYLMETWKVLKGDLSTALDDYTKFTEFYRIALLNNTEDEIDQMRSKLDACIEQCSRLAKLVRKTERELEALSEDKN